ncbi:unnamed protein product [Ostreobium quekettii]|uniref:Uncharacterized protein n=1 Tax=Ostreobium quekettii TaxID=121088 RepID=A0A8S1JAW6_9CHLO|nr:unnamed protein product [Ostreobium quekettii]
MTSPTACAGGQCAALSLCPEVFVNGWRTAIVYFVNPTAAAGESGHGLGVFLLYTIDWGDYALVLLPKCRTCLSFVLWVFSPNLECNGYGRHIRALWRDGSGWGSFCDHWGSCGGWRGGAEML